MASPPKRSDTVSSSSSRPASPSPARSFRNRLTSAARRASTGLSFSQVGKLSRSSSKNSLKLDTAQAQTPPPEDAHVVSPVAESPAREAAANSEDAPVGPSPLANVAATAESPSEPAPPPAPIAQPESIPLTTSPEQVPIPLPSQAPATAPEPLGFKDPIPTTAPAPEPIVVVSSPVIVPQDAPAPAEPEAALPEPTPQPALPAPAAEPPVPSVIEDNRADYFSYSDPVVPTVASIAEPAPVVQPAPVFEPAPAESQAAAPPPPVSHVAIPSDESAFAWSDEPALGHKASRSSFSEPTRHAFEPSAQSGNLSSKASKSSLTSSYGQLISDQTRGRSSSVRFSDDPFADQYAAEVQTTSMPSVETVTMPEAVSMPLPEVEHEETHIHESPTPMRFPLPPVQDVIGSQMPMPRQAAASSAYSLGERDGASLAESVHHDTDERIPLLQHAAPFGNGDRKTGPSRGKTTHVIATFASGPITTEIAASRTLQTLGWTEHILPDSSQYYHHTGMRVTTDIDLRYPKHLQRVTEYLEKNVARETALPPPQGWELWLKNTGTIKPELKLEQCWVNHKMRVLTSVPPPTISGGGLVIEQFTDDDKLDMEYRYWCFIEGHPAHVPLAPETQTEAMDALKWSYTDCLLPASRPAPPPFAPQECQELMNLLRSFDSTSNNALVVQTRVVSRVLLRVAQWRQVYFRPNKPLPRDAIKGVQKPRTPFYRVVLDFIVGCLCLGIPYIFLSRSLHQSFDEESGLYNNGPVLMVSACACLVAAVILSASVTFLSLPQLDDIPRLAGFLAIAFSASSMVSAVIALFRYKAELDRTVMYLGGEGLMVLSGRSIIFSLPLVFLAWAIAAFMTGITLYSFRGATVSNSVDVRHPFEPFTHWAVVGAVGALGGMLTIAALVGRR